MSPSRWASEKTANPGEKTANLGEKSSRLLCGVSVTALRMCLPIAREFFAPLSDLQCSRPRRRIRQHPRKKIRRKKWGLSCGPFFW